MLCPNCRTELVMINGRYICSDCGKEVPEAEVNVGDWSQPAIDGGIVVPEPGSATVGQDSVALDIPEDFIVGEEITESSPSPVLGLPVEAPVQSESVVTAQETDAPEDTGYYQASNTPLSVDLGQLQSTLAGNDITAVVEPVIDTPLAVLPVNQPSEAEEVSDLEPVMGDGAILPVSTEAIPVDPEIYEDPLYDEVLPPAEQSRVQEVQRMPMSKKKMIIMIAAGSFLVLLFIVGGIFAYSSLTSTSDQGIANLPASTEVVDCDKSGNGEAVGSCVAENFTKCSLASWTAPYSDGTNKLTMSYQISGMVDTSCSLEAVAKIDEKDTSTVGKSMTCLLDNTLAVGDAIATVGSTTCSGGLSDILFPVELDITADTSN